MVTIKNNEFSQLSKFIYEQCGINLTPAKKTMVSTRLQKRLRKLNMKTMKEYLAFLFSAEGKKYEIVHLLDIISTNKTDFFREPAHFQYLRQTVLPEFISHAHFSSASPFRVWSAGCSTGEEPYSLAMELQEYAKENRSLRFSILASDISTRVLKIAVKAIYSEEKVQPVPAPYKKQYLMRSKDRTQKLVRIVPELRKTVQFRRLNFMDRDFGIKKPFHAVFCRNVIIYFDRPTQERLINRFANHMVQGAYLFVGHSETLNGLDVPFRQVYPTVYKKIS